MTSITWTRADGETVPGLVFGESDAKMGVVVIQEWWGVTEDTKAQAQLLADRLHARVAIPDLYRGKMSLEAKEAHHLMDGLDWVGAVEDVRGAAKMLLDGGAAKVGVTGFCMGGALALAAGVRADDVISATAPFYGIPPETLANMSEMKIPVLGHFGSEDNHTGFSDTAAADALRDKLTAAGVENEIVNVPGVGHGYMNETETGLELNVKLGRPPYDPAAVAASWDRVAAFFGKHLAE